MSIQQTVKDGVAFLEQTIKDLTAERDYLDARCAELEHYERLSHEWVKEKVEGLNTFEEVEKMVKLAENINRESAKEIIYCGWCKAEFNTVKEIKQHAVICNDNPLVKRLAEFEDFARDFIELEYDNVLRERLEKILYNEKEMK
jgi:hypothetical protein